MVVEAQLARVWTALPGIVQSFDAIQRTVSVQPAINGLARQEDGTTAPLQMPVLLDCPVVFQGGGGVTATFPIAAGDECLVVFSARCIDAWFAQGGVQDQSELRMHNLSDGFALVGLRSLSREVAVDATHACLIADDGATFVKLSPTGKTVAITAPNGINLNGVTIDSSGNVNTSGTVTATTDVVGGGKSLKSHTHQVPGVQAGSSTVPTLAPT